MAQRSLLGGTVLLVGAGAIGRLLDLIAQVFLSRALGAEALGLLQMAMPTAGLLLIGATLGLPVALARFVADRTAVGDEGAAWQAFRGVLFFCLGASLLVIAVGAGAIPRVASHLLADPRAQGLLPWIYPLVVCHAVAAVLLSFFRGLRQTVVLVAAELLGSLSGLLLVPTLAFYGRHYGTLTALHGALVAMTVGSCLNLALFFWFLRKAPLSRTASPQLRVRGEIYALAQTALPIAAARMVEAVGGMIAPLLYRFRAVQWGLSQSAATAAYGSIFGMAAPLLEVPGILTMALTMMLNPIASSASSAHQVDELRNQVRHALLLAASLGLAYAAFLFVAGPALGLLLYHRGDVGRYLQIFSIEVVFAAISPPLAAVLEGLGEARRVTQNAIASVAANLLVLALRPANAQVVLLIPVWADVASTVLMALLNLWAVRRRLGPIFTEEQLLRLLWFASVIVLGMVGTGLLLSDEPILRQAIGLVASFVGIALLALRWLQPVPWRFVRLSAGRMRTLWSALDLFR